ncbi:MAG: phage Gp37/Gp68 family protein [Deinococcales bacterium]
MASTHTGIEWTDKTWNPTTGCTKVSPGCKHCYAEAITKRFKNNFPQGFQFSLHPERLNEPRKWRKASRVFVNSMSDLFHEQMPISFLEEVFEVMNDCPQHIFQILTKREARLLELAPLLNWSDNIWMGVSVENQSYAYRVDHLRKVPAKVRFLSCEPLLGPLKLDLEGIDWVITGGESGPKHRPIEPDWVRDIRDQCLIQQVAFFHKQWGGARSKSNGRELDGQIWSEMPRAWLEHHSMLLTSSEKIFHEQLV